MSDPSAPVEAENPFAGQGAVLLDIGGDVGALVVTMPAEMEGVEVEIRPLGSSSPEPAAPRDHDEVGHGHGHGHGHGGDHDHGPDALPHVAVVNRPVPGGTFVPSLVFGEVREGSYELFVKGTGEVELVVEVRGGEVTTAEWPV